MIEVKVFINGMPYKLFTHDFRRDGLFIRVSMMERMRVEDDVKSRCKMKEFAARIEYDEKVGWKASISSPDIEWIDGGFYLKSLGLKGGEYAEYSDDCYMCGLSDSGNCWNGGGLLRRHGTWGPSCVGRNRGAATGLPEQGGTER